MLATHFRARRGRLLLLAGATVALLVLAAGISSLDLDGGEARAVAPLNEGAEEAATLEGEPVAVNVEAASPLFLLLVVALTVVIAVGMFRSKGVRITVITLLVLATAVVIITELVLANVDRSTSESNGALISAILPAAPDEAAVPEFVREPTAWVNTLIGSVLAAVAAAAGWALWYRRRRSPTAETQALASLARDARLSLGELRTGGDVRDAVLNAYLQMSRTLSKMDGLSRSAAMTPFEFEQQLVRAGLPARAVGRLTRLFEQVRYGGVMAGERERREAIACMETIIAAAHARQTGKTNSPLEALRY